MAPRTRKLLLSALLVPVVVLGAISMIRKDTSELPVYVRAAARMLQGEEIYRPDEAKPFTYPPFFALPFVPLVPLAHEAPQEVQVRGRKIPYPAYDGVALRVVWFVLNLGMLALALRGVHGMLRGARRAQRGLGLAWVLIAALAFRHLWAVLANQSHDYVVLLAVLGAALWTGPGRETHGGCAAGFGAACKATPLLFLPIHLWQRRYRAALALVGALLVLLALPELLLPRGDGGLWLVAWQESFLGKIGPGAPAEAAGAWDKWNYLNQNLAGTLYRLSAAVAPEDVRDFRFDVSIWSPSATTLKYVTLAAQAAVLALLVWITRPALTRGCNVDELRFRRFGEAGAIACGMVLLSPMSSKSHFCVLLLGIAFCVADFVWRRRDPVLGLLLALIFATGALTARDLWGTELGREILARGPVTLCALLVLLATAHVLHHRARAMRRTGAIHVDEVRT